MRIGWLTMEKAENRLPNTVGSSRIRGQWIWESWDEAEEYHVGKHYDAMVFQKAYTKRILEAYQGVKVFDICDPDWMVPRPVFETIALCDAVTTSTQALADYIKRFVKDKPVVCIPDRIRPSDHVSRGKHEGLMQRLAWFGYSAGFAYLERALERVLSRGLHLTVISENPFIPPVYLSSLRVKNITYHYPQVHEELKKADALLLPQPHDNRGSFKSNNKVLTAWALGLPVVQLPEDFDRFETAQARNDEVTKRQTELSAEWMVEKSVAQYQELIESLLAKRP